MIIIKKNLIIINVVLLTACAQIVSPTGGERDSNPPKILKIEPLNSSINFSTNIINITFDEFFEVINPIENVMISPPLNNQPEYKIKGKTLQIMFQDSLKLNTTYTIFFDNCIKDITEGNTIPVFDYFFSTGSNIDSARIEGKLIDALTNLPEKNAFIMLYNNLDDSLPITTKPLYINRTNEKGEYRFNHLIRGNYKIFALSDKNNNLIFDQFTEKIGFLSNPITTNTSTEKIETNFSFFYQADTVQKLLKIWNKQKGITTFAFRNSTFSADLKIIGDTDLKKSFIKETNLSGDTIILYDLDLISDTLQLAINDKYFSDTITFTPSIEQKTIKRKNYIEPKLNCNISNANELYKSTIITSDYPIKGFKNESFQCFKLGKDTVQIPISVNYIDSLKKILKIDFQKTDRTSYNLIVNAGALLGYNNLSNDTLKQQFTVLSEDDYGNLLINAECKSQNQFIIQLINDKENIIDEQIINNSKVLQWRNLLPGIYKLKVIYDSNNNKKWDTGNYYYKLQPEKIIFFPTPIQIRPKWDIEENFVIE